MSIGKTIAEQMEHASWIRRMFEIGARMKRERGEENVFDFTLGNPDGEPPEAVISALRRAVRQIIARQLSQQTGLAYTPDHILMTVGAAGAINVVLKSLLDPGDEVIILVPFFPEYQFYIENHAGRMVLVETDDAFQPDIARIAISLGRGNAGEIPQSRAHSVRMTVDRAEIPPPLAALDARATRLRTFCRKLQVSGLSESYAATHARLAIEAVEVIHERRAMFAAAKLEPLAAPSQAAADQSYVDTATRLIEGLEAALKACEASTDPQRRQVFRAYSESV